MEQLAIGGQACKQVEALTKRQCMMEHLIICRETDREAEREVRERKIVVEKKEC